MDATTASLLGTAIGALTGLAGGFLAGRQQSKLEHQKWLQTQDDEYKKEVRLAVAELTKKLATGAHTISWYTSKAKIGPSIVTENDLLAFDNAMYALYPDIVSSRIVVAALNKEIHTKMTSLVKKLYSLDGQAIKAVVTFRNSQQDGIKELANCYDEAIRFENELIEQVTEIIGLDKREIHLKRLDKK
jgi:hypothetical protein